MISDDIGCLTGFVYSAGLIDFRSDKERIAAYTKGSRKELRKQTKIARKNHKC